MLQDRRGKVLVTGWCLSPSRCKCAPYPYRSAPYCSDSQTVASQSVQRQDPDLYCRLYLLVGRLWTLDSELWVLAPWTLLLFHTLVPSPRFLLAHIHFYCHIRPLRPLPLLIPFQCHLPDQPPRSFQFPPRPPHFLLFTPTTDSPSPYNKHQHKHKHPNTKESLRFYTLTVASRPLLTPSTPYLTLNSSRLVRALTNLVKTLLAKLLRSAASFILVAIAIAPHANHLFRPCSQNNNSFYCDILSHTQFSTLYNLKP